MPPLNARLRRSRPAAPGYPDLAALSSEGTSIEVTVAVVTWRGRDHLGRCLDSLRAQTVPHRLLVIDNASDDGTAQILERYPEAAVVRLPCNVGFAGGLQQALALTTTPFIAVLNDDADAEPTWLSSLCDALSGERRIAAATSQIRLRDGRVNNVGVGINRDGYGYDVGLGDAPGDWAEARAVFGFCGGGALLRVSDIQAVGAVPAEYFLYYEDTDTSWRLRLHGLDCVYVPKAVVHHSHSASSDQGSRLFAVCNERNRLRMLVRCAPWPVAVRELLRHALTTTSLAVRRLRGTAPDGWHFNVALRVGVWGRIVGELPQLISQRRRLGRGVTSSRRSAVWDKWSGALE